MRYQELLFSAPVLGAAIAMHNCHHPRSTTDIEPDRVLGLARDCEKARLFAGPFLLSGERLALEIHTAHATHSAAALRHAAGTGVLLRQFGHHGFGGDQERRNRGCVLDRHTNDLGRIDDALGD
jgi:hypothetical protein